MKLSNSNSALLYRRRNQGYAAVAMVLVVSITALVSLAFVFRQGMRSHEVQIRNQVKIDYQQKEDALLRALIAIVPNKAIGAMQHNSANTAAEFSWNTIFAQAIAASNSTDALSQGVIDTIGIPGIIEANTGDTALASVGQIVSVVAGNGVLVGPGSISNTGLLSSPLVGGDLPPGLNFAGSAATDNNYPIISKLKTYPATTPGLGASADPNQGWNLYNSIDYPDIRFGLAAQDGRFVAKRNWWAFSLSFGANDTVNSGVPVVTKNYVLSIYEVPGQHAISSGSKLDVGSFGAGGAWTNVNVKGGVFAADVTTSGNLGLTGSGSQISARRSITLGAGTTVNDGNSVSNGFNTLGAREIAQAATETDFYGASIASDSGRVAVLPLSQGLDFLRRDEDPDGMKNTLSPTPWDRYALGARQCGMQIEIAELNGTMPTKVIFHYMASGIPASITYDQDTDTGGWRNGEWENRVETFNDPSPIPFYQEYIKQTGTWGLGINLSKFPGLLAQLGGGMTENNSLSIWANTTNASVDTPDPINNDSTEMGVTLRKCADLTGFTDGLSIVTDYRVYFAESFNQTTQSKPPVAHGLPAGPYYPPVSVFTTQKRFGAMRSDPDQLHLEGRLTSLADDDGTTVNPLDLRTSAKDVDTEGGISQVMKTSTISADLEQVVSPAQLPPISKMTWLVTIEEIH